MLHTKYEGSRPKDTLLKSLNTTTPKKTLKGNKSDLPWMSKKIKKMIHKKTETL